MCSQSLYTASLFLLSKLHVYNTLSKEAFLINQQSETLVQKPVCHHSYCVAEPTELKHSTIVLNSSYLEGREIMVDKEGQTSNWYNEELHTECVMVTVICSLELVIHKVHCCVGACNEDAFHGAVIH